MFSQVPVTHNKQLKSIVELCSKVSSQQCRSTNILEESKKSLFKNGKSFNWACKFMDQLHANRATRLYGFCRLIDDIADEAQVPEEALATLGRIDHDLRAGTSSDPFISDAIGLFNECGISIEIPRLLIAGVSGDLYPVRVKTQDELLQYCYRVAGTVGLMMCAILDTTDPRAKQHAIDLGIAMQLTNLCRDVSEDAHAGRRYLPESLTGNIEPDRLSQPSPVDYHQVQTALVSLLALADTYYASGENGLKYLPLRTRYAILVAGRIYCSIGNKLRKRAPTAWQKRAFVSGFAKAVISVTALISFSFKTSHKPHQPKLHKALAGFPGVDQRADTNCG